MFCLWLYPQFVTLLFNFFSPFCSRLADDGRFALSQAVKVLQYYTDYYGIAYPLPKLDLISIPKFACGAMGTHFPKALGLTCADNRDIQSISLLFPSLSSQTFLFCVSILCRKLGPHNVYRDKSSHPGEERINWPKAPYLLRCCT